jgi:glycosyltransferase involved in cell wall biosynthesis
MSQLPTISIVVPSFNQASFISETLASLVDQKYPNLEVIVQDGGSTDGAVEIARGFVEKHPGTFQLFVERDHGQAHALNLGFARTRGEILGFLNTDDTLLPGCLHRVAQEIDLARGRHVVMGRCQFTGEDSPYGGAEHPSEWTGFRHQLAIWERGYNTVPQPSVFWTRDVWERCGGFDEGEAHVLDYDLFLRFGRHYRFHKVDEVWSTYRIHPVSKSAQRTEAEVLSLSIAASRKYWGGWWSPLRWRLAWSHWRYARYSHERARHYARRVETAFAYGKYGRAAIDFVWAFVSSPTLAWHRLLVPRLSAAGLATAERAALSRRHSAGKFSSKHPDDWIGPLYREHRIFSPRARQLVVNLEHRGRQGRAHKRLTVELWLAGKLAAKQEISQRGNFSLEADVVEWAGRSCDIEIKSTSYFIPQFAEGELDFRALSVILKEISVIED